MKVCQWPDENAADRIALLLLDLLSMLETCEPILIQLNAIFDLLCWQM